MTDNTTHSAPIFVVGTGRSGTTLLRNMLCAHPHIHLTHEASFYVWDQLFGRRGEGDAFLEYFFRTFSFRWLGLHPEEVRAQLKNIPPRPEAHRLFTAVMHLAASRQGKTRHGDKTPGHAAHLTRIFRDYPDARVVHIVRDPRGTLLSLSRMPWASGSDLANAWLYENDWRATQPFLDRLLRIKLETLLEEPEATLRSVLDFVGEPWDPAVLDHAAHPPRPPDIPPLPWLVSSTRALGRPEARWEGLAPARIRQMEGLCGKSMKAYGYSSATLSNAPGALRTMLSILAQIPEALRFGWTYLRLGLLHRQLLEKNEPKRLRVFHRLNPGAWAHYPGFEMPRPPPLFSAVNDARSEASAPE